MGRAAPKVWEGSPLISGSCYQPLLHVAHSSPRPALLNFLLLTSYISKYCTVKYFSTELNHSEVSFEYSRSSIRNNYSNLWTRLIVSMTFAEKLGLGKMSWGISPSLSFFAKDFVFRLRSRLSLNPYHCSLYFIQFCFCFILNCMETPNAFSSSSILCTTKTLNLTNFLNLFQRMKI